jgi:hypothetical protein
MRVTVVVVLGLVCSLSAVPTAAAGPPVGFVRVAHFSPDGPDVDVYVDGARTLAGVAYLQFAPDVPAMDIAMRGGPVLFSSVTFPNVGRPVEVVQIPDAAAAMAVAGADAGMGGMARRGRLAPGGPSIPLAALLLAAVTLWASRRRRA